MWVIFRKSDNEVVGLSADSEIDLDKDVALQEVVSGLVDVKDPKDYDAFQVKGHDKTAAIREKLVRPTIGKTKVQPGKGGDTDLEVVGESVAERGGIAVTTNATQFHPVDGVPLIPGDGQSFLLVTLQKSDDGGKPLVRKTKDNDVIWLRIDQGRLLEDKDQNPQEIRSVTLVAGTAKFRIQSAAAKRLATVQMLTANPELRVGGLRVEFT
ncbi:MAG TPA: hypothetical protein VFR31_05075 [Thermoanaerobaculia bacterium]|nr:hypothetical protein [Thermoanaerobaculia bacterium]